MAADNMAASKGAMQMLTLKVCSKTIIAEDTALFELIHPEHEALPPFSAGAHISVMTPKGLLRRYSLCNAPAERNRYLIAVKRDSAGSGGSVSLVDDVNTGDFLQVSAPENHFPLAAEARQSLLIAGGIGITPLLSMVHELRARNADFRLVYCARHPEATAFLEELSAPGLAERVTIHHSHGDPARSLDLATVIPGYSAGMQIYCCGPRRLMQEVRALTRDWPSAAVHFEDFGTSEHPAANGETAFSVRLARSGVTLQVNAGTTILEAVRRHGLDAPSSCESGTCGECRTRLLSGTADHRDYVLDEDEQESAIMICVSRAKCGELVLDL